MKLPTTLARLTQFKRKCEHVEVYQDKDEYHLRCKYCFLSFADFTDLKPSKVERHRKSIACTVIQERKRNTTPIVTMLRRTSEESRKCTSPAHLITRYFLGAGLSFNQANSSAFTSFVTGLNPQVSIP